MTSTKNQLGGDGDELFERDTNDASFKKLLRDTPKRASQGGSKTGAEVASSDTSTAKKKSKFQKEWKNTSVGLQLYNNISSQQKVVKGGNKGISNSNQGGKRAVNQQQQQSSISEAIFPELLNEQVSTYNGFMGGADVLVPEKILQRPTDRLSDMVELRTELIEAAQEVNTKIEWIYSTIKANTYQASTDEGLLEVDFTEYEECFFADVEQVTEFLDKEVGRLQADLAKAKEDAGRVVGQLDSFLKQNHQIVQDFLKTTNKTINTIAHPSASREDTKESGEDLLQAAETMKNEQKSLYAASFMSNDNVVDVHSAQYNETDFWEPCLRKMRAHGMVHSEKFLWPGSSLLRQLDLSKKIKLCGIELGTTSNLYEVRLCFTGGLRSPLLRAEGACASLADENNDNQQHFEIDPSKLITDVYMNQNPKTGMIYGLRIVDESGNFLLNKEWNKFQSITKFLPDQSAWRHYKIPRGSEIIGCHGSTDSQYIRSFGWVVWTPNPVAIKAADI